MTDDAKRIMAAFREAPVMTLQAVTTMTGLSEHTTRFILEQLRQAGWVINRHERWSLAEGDILSSRGDGGTQRSVLA